MNHSTNEFRTINRFPGYRFYSDGYVMSAWQPAGMGHGMKVGRHWHRLKPGTVKGYKVLRLSNGNGTIERIQLHVAIAEAFWGPKPRPEMDCCHNDGDRSHSALSNLRYDTKAGNCADKHKHGTMYGGERHHDARLTVADVLRIREERGQQPIADVARRYGISIRSVFNVLSRHTWKHV
jgi:hypothetical protein